MIVRIGVTAPEVSTPICREDWSQLWIGKKLHPPKKAVLKMDLLSDDSQLIIWSLNSGCRRAREIVQILSSIPLDGEGFCVEIPSKS